MLKHFLLFLLLILPTACNQSQPTLKPLNPGDTILAFGDSLTYGTGTTQITSYPAELEKITGYKVINAGIPGEETSTSLTRISTVLSEYHPTLVIICLGGNDLIRKRPLTTIKENLRSIIKIAQQSGAQVLLIAVPTPTLSLNVPDFYSELGTELHIIVDTTTLPTLLGNQSLKSDYIHLNAAGYRALAEQVATYLKKK